MNESIFSQMFSNEQSDSFVEVILSHLQAKNMPVLGLLISKEFKSTLKDAKQWVKDNGFTDLTRHSILNENYLLFSKDFNENDVNDNTLGIRYGVKAFVREVIGDSELSHDESDTIQIEGPIKSNFVEQQLFDFVEGHVVSGETLEYDTESLVFTARVAIPGTVGTSPDGKVRVVYNDEALINTELSEFTILNINHNPAAVIGELVGLQIERTELRPELIVSFRVFEHFSHLAEVIRSNKYDGFSIETNVFEFERTDEPFTFEALSMELTGLALLLAVPPACPKEVCHLLSSAFPQIKIDNLEEVDEDIIISELDSISQEDMQTLLEKVNKELSQRNA